MCTRYYMELSPELRPIIEEAKRSSLGRNMVATLGRALVTEGEVRPTNIVPVIAPDPHGNRKVFPMVWGFHFPGIDRPVVNARVESAGQKAAFQESWLRRRCIIPASWYYEWSHVQRGGKVVPADKYAIQTPGAQVTWLAGIYRIEETESGFHYPVFTVLTRNPSQELLKIHDRMPVVLPTEAIDPWILPDASPKEIKELAVRSITDMVAEKI